MESETASSADEQQAPDTRGKHRILAELKRVEQESRFLEVSFSSCFCFGFSLFLFPVLSRLCVFSIMFCSVVPLEMQLKDFTFGCILINLRIEKE